MPIRAERRLRGVWSGRSAAQSSGSTSRSAREPPGRTSRRAANPPPPAWCSTRRRAAHLPHPTTRPAPCSTGRRAARRPPGATWCPAARLPGRPARPGRAAVRRACGGVGPAGPGVRGRRCRRCPRWPNVGCLPDRAPTRSTAPGSGRSARRGAVRPEQHSSHPWRQARPGRAGRWSTPKSGRAGWRLRGWPRTARPRRRPPQRPGRSRRPRSAARRRQGSDRPRRPHQRALHLRRDARGCRQRSVAGPQVWASAGSREPPAPRRPPGPVSTAGAG